MKALILLFSLVFVGCVISGVKTRAVAQEDCNIENYKDFINKEGVHNCNLQGADLRRVNLRRVNLRRADLQEANLQGANLQGANLRRAVLYKANLEGVYLKGAKVIQEQAIYLKAKGLWGFVVVE